MTPTNWTLTRSERIATLTLNRPRAMNALTPEALYELRDISQQLAADSSLWVVVLQAEGPHFSVGVDVATIGGMIGQDEAAVSAQLSALQACLDAFDELPQMKVARLRGHCIGGGLLLALCCTFRVADETTRFSLPEVQLGIPVVMGTQRITRAVGLAAARRLILLAQPCDAQEAQRLGLVDAVTTPEALDAEVGRMAERLASLPPLTLRVARRLIEEGGALSLTASQAWEVEAMLALLRTADFAEGVAAFREKRPARFSGG